MRAVKEEDGSISVTGNACPRGVKFAEAEMTRPMRSLTTTVPTVFEEMPYLPVRTNREVLREDLDKVIAELRKFKLDKPVKCGDILIQNVAMTGSDIIAASDI